MKIHDSIEDSLSHSISEKELQNIKLKKRISELVEALTPKPLFSQRLAIILAKQTPPSTLGTSKPIRKAVQMYNGVKVYVFENINKIL
jgi:hypothetical protein